MKIPKENIDFIYDFINEDLKFHPNCKNDCFFLPFSINRPFTVYDISKMTDSQIDLMYELIPNVIVSCLPAEHMVYAINWQHNTILYDPRDASKTQSEYPCIEQYNKDGILYYEDFYLDGDYLFFIEKFGRFAYLSHPWRQEIWVYGERFLSEIKKIHEQLGFEIKSEML